MDNRLMTFKEVAAAVGIPESSARWVKDRYSEWIPVVGMGRQRRYPPVAIEIIRLAATMTRQGIPQDVIEAELSARYERIIEGNTISTTTATTTQSATTQEHNALAAVDAAALADLLNAQLAPVLDELHALRNEVARLTALVELQRRQLAAPPPPPQDTQETPPSSTTPAPSRLDRLRRWRPWS